MAEALRVLIVDDEPPARRRLRALLADEPDTEVIAECGDGRTAVDVISSQRPDLVFMDVEMPELNGLEVIEAVGPVNMPPAILVSAYDQYAVRAFSVYVVDYLLKPFTQERFAQALRRGREQRRDPRPDMAGPPSLLPPAPAAVEVLERIAVRVGDRMRLLPLAEVSHITAAANYVRLHTSADTYLTRGSMGSMEQRLDASRFVRLHRSLMVNAARVRELEPLTRGEYAVWMEDGTRLVSGRSYRSRVQQLFGV
jgi:two-component system, LytTR family, response regulator